MNILEFTQRFPDEKSCRNYLKDLRVSYGITCPKCETHTRHFYLSTTEKFQCSVCDSRTNLRKGTIMEKSKVPVHTWFMCIHLMTTTKKPFSCLELQRQLGIKKYETCQMLMNKIRCNMGIRENKYPLKGEIEMDDAFFEVVDLPFEKDELGNEINPDNSILSTPFRQKRGRGSQGKQKVLVMVESRPREQTNRYKKSREMGYVKMLVIDELDNDSVNYEVQRNVKPDSHIISDNWRGFSRIGEVVREHSPMIVKSKESMKKLPWVHTIISNCKREFLGTHHSVSRKYLQNYLNEFCYKLNRRGFETDLFDRMLISGVKEGWN